MPLKKREPLENRIKKLEAENQSLKEKLALFKKENLKHKRSLKDREMIFHSLPAGIILIQRGKIIEINDTLLKQLGYRSEDVIGRDFLDLIHPDQKTGVSRLHDLWDSGKIAPDQYDVLLIKRDKKTIFCDVKIQGIRLKNRKAFLLNLTRLEERKEKEREEIRSRKMEALTTMASGLKDELFRCGGCLESGIRDLRAVLYPGQKDISEILKQIENSSWDVRSIARDMDVFAGAVNDEQAMIPFDLNESVREAVSSSAQKWKAGLESQGIRVDLKTFLRSSATVKGHPEGLRDMIVHMINNSVDAMPRGGEIYITTEDSAGSAHIYIQDNGIGISEKNMDKIFDPFFTTKDSVSMGLGLSLSYAIIKNHNGIIEVSSLEGQGTIFHIILPCILQGGISKSKAHRTRIKEAQILIIQDKDVARELLSHQLTSRGCRVDTAVDGMEGLGKLKRKKFDLMIADIETLDVEEDIFLKKSRDINPDLAVVFIRGEDVPLNLNPIDESMAVLSVLKPFDISRVSKQVAEFLMSL